MHVVQSLKWNIHISLTQLGIHTPQGTPCYPQHKPPLAQTSWTACAIILYLYYSLSPSNGHLVPTAKIIVCTGIYRRGFWWVYCLRLHGQPGDNVSSPWLQLWCPPPTRLPTNSRVCEHFAIQIVSVQFGVPFSIGRSVYHLIL